MAKAARVELPSEPITDHPVIRVEPDPQRVVAKPPDPTQPIECSALLLSRPPGVNQTDPAIRVGSYTSNSINVGGLCERIVLHPNGTYVVHVRRSVTRLISAEERQAFPLQYLVFREGFGEVAT